MPRRNRHGLPPGIIFWPGERGPDGRALYGIRYRAGGRQIREKVGSSLAAAKRLLAIRKGHALEGRDVGRCPRPTVGQAIDRYLPTVIRLTSYRAVQRYADDVRLRFGCVRLDELQPAAIDAWLADLGTRLAPASVNQRRAFLNRLYVVAVDNEWCDRNPVAKTRRLRTNNARVRWATPEEYHRLLANTDDAVLRCAIVVAVATGLRLAELLSLKRTDIDIAGRVITVRHPKGDRAARHVPISDGCLEALQAMLSRAKSDWVFSSRRTGRHMSRWGLRKRFEAALAAAGIRDFCWHDLRHTAASWMTQRGVPAKAVQEILGHSGPAMTDRYQHLAAGHLLAAVRTIDDLLRPYPE